MPDPSTFFDCQMCGDCCRGYGGTYLTAKDVEAIAGHLKIAPDLFLHQYCQMSGRKPVLKMVESGYCIFWDKVCTIHAIKPRMCKLWPFINGVLRDPANWEAMHSMCPGIRKDVDYDDLLSCIRQVLAEFDKEGIGL